MKYLLVLMVVGVAFWIWRNNRKDALQARQPRQAPRVPQAVVRCAHCGVHVPQTDAVVRNGVSYCCVEHAAAGRPAAASHTDSGA